MFGTDVHSASNSLSLPVLIDLVYLYSNDVQSEICSIHWAVKDASLWAYVNANIHLHHTQASCGSLLFRFHCVTSLDKHPQRPCWMQLMDNLERSFHLLHLLASLSARL